MKKFLPYALGMLGLYVVLQIVAVWITSAGYDAYVLESINIGQIARGTTYRFEGAVATASSDYDESINPLFTDTVTGKPVEMFNVTAGDEIQNGVLYWSMVKDPSDDTKVIRIFYMALPENYPSFGERLLKRLLFLN